MPELNSIVEGHYASLESRWCVSDGTNEYARLVVPHGNSDEPVHRWFHLKEAYSYALVRRIIKDLDIGSKNRLRILDCFAGGGTTLVSAAELEDDFPDGVDVSGIESNPFLYRLSRAKAHAALRPRGLSAQFRQALEAVQQNYADTRITTPPPPSLSTWNNDDYFTPSHRESLLRIRASIEPLPEDLAKELLTICAAATVEPSSRLRRDGRALRFARDRTPRDPWDEFLRRCHVVLEDIQGSPRDKTEVSVQRGDGRRLDQLVNPANQYDLILFSPPYPNNIDYTEVYKIEAWYLGAYANSEDFRQQRLETIRSHPSLTFPDAYNYRTLSVKQDIDALLSPLLAAIPSDRYKRGRVQLIKGYADDMLAILKAARKKIAPGGKVVFVVGNSVHGAQTSGFVIAADIVMARLAEFAGWNVTEIKVARKLWRRGFSSPYLRESVVVLTDRSESAKESGVK